MKKKKWLLPLCVVAAVLLCVLFHMASGFTVSTGRCLTAEPANCFMLIDNRPIKLNYKGKINFQTGDKLLVLHQNVYAESDPEQTLAHLILKIGSDTKNLVPKKEQEILIETANPPERILAASEITTVRITLEDGNEAYHNPELAETVETTDPELIALVAALRDGLNPRDVNRPMDFPRYVITFEAYDGCTNDWRLDQCGVISGDHLGLGNHWLDSAEPYKVITQVFERLAAPEDFSFSLTWNCFGVSSYDSQTGKLVKTTDASNPDDYVTSYNLTDAEKTDIYQLISALDVNSYPDVYDPGNGLSEPSMTLILTVRADGIEKTIQAKNIALSYESGNEKGQVFLTTCKTIHDLLMATEAWKALPDYEHLYK